MESRFQATLHPYPQPAPQVDLLCPPPLAVPGALLCALGLVSRA